MKVLIVDDEPSIVNLIRMNLKLEGYDSVCAYSGREAVEAYAAQKPDIVLLDIMLPDMDGYDVLRAIQELDRSAAVIFITANDKRTSKILGLELGADDYITKPFDNKELVLRVKTLWRRIRLTRGAVEAAPPPPEPEGAASRPSAVLACGELALDPDAHTVLVAGSEVSLTYREFDVLCYLMQNRRRVLGREELLENIWGYSFMGNTRAVDILMGRLRQKLGSAGEYIRTVYGVGYRFEGPEK
ncbi:MAG: response regulator transcription factor [Angelakisella sp.]|jgi:DNA-binding response OmpR family regulator|nr:response regulator transcription factor [Angelakisella sp.]MCI9666180.1 response regulator transcription factor [Angelakisella sp.]